MNKTFRPLLRGSLLNKYSILWDNNYYISFGDWLAEPRYSANYEAEIKIVIRQTGSSLIATIDDRQFIVRDNLYTIISNDTRYSEFVLLSLINSKFLNWYYQNIINNEVGEALAQVKRGHIQILPLPEFSQPSFNSIENLVKELLKIKRDDPNRITESFEKKIDYLVYKLYDLSEEEVIGIEELL